MARYKSKEIAEPKGKALTKAEAPQQRRTAEHKKRLFIVYYFKEANGAKAAALAGHQGSQASLSTQANQYLRDPYVKAELERRRKLAEERTGVTTEKLLRELGKLAFANMEDYIRVDEEGDPRIDLSSLTPEQWAAIEEVTTETYWDAGAKSEVKRVKIKLHSKLGAIEKAGKHLGMFGKSGSGRMLSGEADDDGEPAQNISYTLNIGNASINVSQDGTSIIPGKAPALLEAPDQGEEE